MTKVCHLSSAHSPEDIRIFVKECASLAANGYETHLIATGEGADYWKNNVSIHLIPKRGTSRWKRMLLSVRDVYNKALEINADIYHLHDPELLQIALKLKRKGKKVIYDAHEDLPRQIMAKYWIPTPFRKAVALSTEYYENYVCGRLDGLVAATPTIAKRFAKVQKNVATVNNYPLLKEFDQEPNLNMEKENYICYVGGLTEVRGVTAMVKAMAFLPDLKLKLGGLFSPESYYTRVQNMPEFIHVDYLGMLSRDEVKSLLQKAKVGLVTLLPTPNIVDSQPIKLFEYMAAALPVIASDFPLWRQIVEDAQCGLCVDPNNPKAIAEAVLQILKDPAQASEMGMNGRKSVLEKYNWESQEPILLNLYAQISK